MAASIRSPMSFSWEMLLRPDAPDEGPSDDGVEWWTNGEF